MAKLIATILLVAGLAATPLEAGFRSPESLVRNVYGYYGNGSPGFSGGLPHDAETAQKFFDRPLQKIWASAKPPSDFLVQSTAWKIGAISITTTRRQFDRTCVAASFSNNGRAVSLNFILAAGPDGWVIIDIESPHDSLRSFLTQYRE